MKYFIIGDGFIGNYLARNLPEVVLIKNKIYDPDILRRLLTEAYPSMLLINCAGKTGKPNVDACEGMKDAVFGSNVGLPVMIAEIMKELKSYWVHIGSGCVYNGYDKDWDEEDEPNFLGSFYSRTKKWSQDILKDFDEPLVLRIRMPILEGVHERCYVNKVISYAKAGYPIFDMPNSMTYLPDMVKAIIHLTEKGCTGEYNIVNKGSLSPIDILKAYKENVDSGLVYNEASYEDVRKTLKADRSNCILSVGKLESEGFMVARIEDRIRDVMVDLKNGKYIREESKHGK